MKLQLCVGTEVGLGDVMPCLNVTWSVTSPSTVLLRALISLGASSSTGQVLEASGVSAVATVTEFSPRSASHPTHPPTSLDHTCI